MIAAPPPLAARGGVDIDGDGRAELVVRNSQGSTLVGRFNSLTNQFLFTALADPGVNYRYVGLLDITGNGKTDLAIQNLTQGDFGDVTVWTDFLPTSQSLLRTVKRTWDVQAVGDLDGDGYADLVWRYMGFDPTRPGDTGVSYVWFSNGAATTPVQVRKRGGAPLNWKLLGAIDLNGDGAADMVYISPDNQIRVLMATASRTCANLAAGNIPAGFAALKLADFTGSGRGDILIRNATTGETRLLSLNATGLPLPAPTANPDDPNASCTASNLIVLNSTVNLLTTDPSWNFYAADDFDGDGFADIVWLRSDNTIALWKMNGTPMPSVIVNIGAAPTGYVAFTTVATDPVPAPAVLNINAGIRAVTKTPSASIDVFANADPSGMVFDTWTGDTASLLVPGERRSGALLVAGTKNITATFKPLPAFTPSTIVLNGQPASTSTAVNAYWYFPTALPLGVIFRFHGTGGSGSAQFSKVEEQKFARDAVASGFAVVSLDSSDRVNKSWDSTTIPADPMANVDVVNIQQLISNFRAQALINANTPIFASGHSDGAGAALRFAFLLNWKASHQSCVPGTPSIAQATTVPGIWTMAQNDTFADPQRAAKALDNANALAARGIASQYILVPPSAVYPSRFTQISGISTVDSQNIYNALRAAGLLDANDYLISDPNLTNFTPIIPTQYQSYSQDIVGQIFAAYSAHQFSTATSRRVLDFFRARL